MTIAQLTADGQAGTHASGVVPLDTEWEFAYGRPDGRSEGFPSRPSESRFDAKMPVPGYWDDHVDRLEYTKFWSRDVVFNPQYRPIRFPMGSGKPADASLPYILGTGWYRTTFIAAESRLDGTAVLDIGGVALEAWVWLNGEPVHHHVGHLTGFQVDLTPGLREGENEILIAVANTRTDRIGCSIRGFAGQSGGITRPVRLLLAGPSRIADAFVHGGQDLQTLHWQVEVAESRPCGELELRWRVERDGSLIADGSAEASAGLVRWRTGAEGIEPWSDRHPALHTVTVELWSATEGRLDERSWSFGLRALRAEGTSLLLNGDPVFLRGATDHAYFPETTTPPTDVEFYRSTLRELRSLGFNWIRFHTWTPPEECLIAADELGMLLQVEAPNGFREADWLDIIRTCRPHPSVVIYCCGNEVAIDDDLLDLLEWSSAQVHERAPGTLFDPMEGLRNVEYELDASEEGYVGGEHPYHEGRLRRLAQFSDVFAPHGAIFSYHSLETDRERIGRRLSMHDRPSLMHEVGINDSFIDLSLEERYRGTRTGTDLYASARSYLTRKGLIDRAPRYFENSCRWQSLVAKYALENTRRSERIAGYDYLGAIDCHWHRSGYAVGLMNEFYELKPGLTPELVRRFNGESVLLADCGTRRNLAAGSTRVIPMQVSWFAGVAAADALLEWRLVDDHGEVLDHGSRRIAAIADGSVCDLGDVHVQVPSRDDAIHATFAATLSAGPTSIDNAWDFWVFPAVDPIAASASDADTVRIVDDLDADTAEWMNRGGRVLLRGAGPFPTAPTTFQLMSGGRTVGNNATVVEDHETIAGFPHDGFCDWQFFDMIERGSAVVFTDLDVPFDPIVEIVSGYKVVRPQAALFELAVGAGGLIVCTFAFDDDDPGARHLLRTLLDRLRSGRFAPRSAVAPSQLTALTARTIHLDLTTDEGYDDGGHVPVI